MSDALPHGLHYVSRDGMQTWHLDRLAAARSGLEAKVPRPERDVLESLLRFCLEACEHWTAVERYGLVEPTSLPAAAASSGLGDF